MSEPPSSPLAPSPTSFELESEHSEYISSTPKTSPLAPSPVSSPAAEQPSKKRRTWQVFPALGQPGRSTMAAWRRLGFEDEASIASSSQTDTAGTSRLTAQEEAQESQCESDQESNEDSNAGSVSLSEHSTINNSTSDHYESDRSASDVEERVMQSSDAGSPSISEYTDSNSEQEFVSDSDSNSIDSQEMLTGKLFVGSDKTVDEAVFDLLNDHFRNKETQKSLSCHLKTFLKYLPKPNKMLQTVKQLFKYIENLDPTFTESTHFYCAECLLYWEDDTSYQCEGCQSISKKTFFSFSIEDQIRHYFENCNLGSEIEKNNRDRNSNITNGMINDICDGSEYKKLGVSNYDITLLWYTDGVSVSHSSKTNLWPIQFVMCELPPQLRPLYIGVCGIWCDVTKPVMNVFLEPFVQSMKEIDRKGGITWKHPVTGELQRSSVFAPLACADAPARADLQNIMSHNAKYACNTCEQKTVKLPLSHEDVEARQAGAKVRRKRGFVFTEEAVRLRSGDRMKKQGNKAILSSLSNVKGVKGRTCVERIPRLDISTFVFAEYMHGVCLGVVRMFLTLWLCVPGPWNIKSSSDKIDKFMESVKPSSDVGRISRCVSEYPRWKASEFRQWLLFTSLPAVAQYLPALYVQHWMLLVMAVFILLQDKISFSEIHKAEIMLRMFVRDIAVLYRNQDYVYNVHQLLHLTLYVKRWGPLWATSAFSFESFNGILIQMTHGTKNRAKELTNSLRRAHGLQILKNKIVFGEQLQMSSNTKTEMFNRHRLSTLSDNDIAFLESQGLDFASLAVYARVKVGREIFTSLLYTCEKARNNFTICYTSSVGIAYGEINYFVFTSNQNELFAYVRVFQVEHSRFFFHSLSRSRVTHIVPVRDSDEKVLIRLNEIVSKVIRVESFVCKLPNKYEQNL